MTISISRALADTFSIVTQRPRWVLTWWASLAGISLVGVVPLLLLVVTAEQESENLWPFLYAQLSIIATQGLLYIGFAMASILVMTATGFHILGRQRQKVWAGLKLSPVEFIVGVLYLVGSWSINSVASVLILFLMLIGAILYALNIGLAVVITLPLSFLALIGLALFVARTCLILPVCLDLGRFDLVLGWQAARSRQRSLFGLALATFALLALLSLMAVALGLIVVISVVLAYTWLHGAILWLVAGLAALVTALSLSAIVIIMSISIVGPFVSAWRQLKSGENSVSQV